MNEGYFRAPLGREARSCEDLGADCSSSGNWYDVPFGVMLPKDGQASNLLVPVAISSTSVAYASTRIENMFMDLGSAAGVAVALLLDAQDAAIPSGSCPRAAVQSVNVTAVQHVLQSVYGQRVHGPPGSDPAPGPQSFAVVGAGAAEWDGNYPFTGTFTDDRPVFAQATNSTRRLYSYNNIWRLAVDGKEIFYVTAQPTQGAEPPLTGWAVANATAPAPHLVAGPTLR